MTGSRRFTQRDQHDCNTLNDQAAQDVLNQLGTVALNCPACLTRGRRSPLEITDALRCSHCDLMIELSVDGWPHHYRRNSC
jgi:hypothetical protein